MTNTFIIMMAACLSLIAFGLAAFTTPMETAGSPTLANGIVLYATLAYLISLVLLLFNIRWSGYLLVASIAVSLAALPFAAYPLGELNAAYDLVSYLAAFSNGILITLLFLVPKVTGGD
ncbi:MAG: hypothetical protein L7S45_05825 [Luminiphilus sp.]|nr:hypothetical protein [Luminiphilus sp.]